jgi:heme/copper-type cytochrome/quinol oxidase subunit 2
MLLIITSITGIFKTIITVLIIFLLFRWLSNMFSVQNRNNENNTTVNNPTKEETTFSVTIKKTKNVPSDKGEYVDYEEIK